MIFFSTKAIVWALNRYIKLPVLAIELKNRYRLNGIAVIFEAATNKLIDVPNFNVSEYLIQIHDEILNTLDSVSYYH